MVRKKIDYSEPFEQNVLAAATDTYPPTSDTSTVVDASDRFGTDAPKAKREKVVKAAPTRGRRAVAEGPLERVACHGCGRTCGYATGQRYRVFHAPWCAKYPAVDPVNEARNHRIEFLIRRGKSTKAVADGFGLTRQRVQQILASR